MKNLVIVFLAILFSNIAYATYVNGEISKEPELITLEFDLPPYFDDEDCYNGGYGASACGVEAGINFGMGATTKCEVACVPGTYACCGLRCICKLYE